MPILPRLRAAADAGRNGGKMITLTPNAIRELKRMMEKDGKTDQALRIGVKGGGCSGLSYVMNFDAGGPKEWDEVFDFDGLRVFVDKKSYLYVNGMEVEFSTELPDVGFKFRNPNAAGSCGCGTSFSV